MSDRKLAPHVISHHITANPIKISSLDIITLTPFNSLKPGPALERNKGLGPGAIARVIPSVDRTFGADEQAPRVMGMKGNRSDRRERQAKLELSNQHIALQAGTIK